MGVSLREKEMEREQLVRELDQTKEVGVSAEIASRLREKEKHIASLRKKQKELRNLTSVSSRNDSEISRLQTDVKSMKHKKVSLQKQMTEERKAHAIEVKRMQKTAMQKDREMSKLKKTSNQHEMQAQKANQVAKARLGELGNLRTKYKDTEKRLKRLSLKRGVLAKAGLDPIIVGRRDSDRTKKEAASKVDGSRAGAIVDADLLRDHFDKKVADVVRKEAIVDRLAQEWEEHFELTLRRDELKLEDIEDAEDSLQSLSVRIRFKEDRIRHLAKRLGKQQQSTTASNVSSVQRDSFLYDDAFEKICKGKCELAVYIYRWTVLVSSAAHSCYICRCFTRAGEEYSGENPFWYDRARTEKDCCPC
jgi:myosin heavy subunit